MSHISYSCENFRELHFIYAELQLVGKGQQKKRKEKVTGIRPMAPVLNTGALEGI